MDAVTQLVREILQNLSINNRWEDVVDVLLLKHHFNLYSCL